MEISTVAVGSTAVPGVNWAFISVSAYNNRGRRSGSNNINIITYQRTHYDKEDREAPL